jgi:tetratricopeptide (TPR) repeat protein
VLLVSCLNLSLLGCALPKRSDPPQLIYTPEEFRSALLERVPDLRDSLAEAPFIVGPEDIAKADARMREAPRGPDRVRALVQSLSAAQPEGFGLQYHWLASASAQQTLESGAGNCVALASVLVGLGRGLGWPIYYAIARARLPETREYQEVTFVSDHMVVIVAAKSFQMIIDFTGQVGELYDVVPIDDLTAYAHLINNIAGQHIAQIEGKATEEDWRIALQGFELASQIQPDLARAWNNRGIALTRLARYEEAQIAYERALSLDTLFGSTSHNLEIMRTRAHGQTIVAEEPVSR